MAGRPALSAGPPEQSLDTGDGRTVSRYAAGHTNAESVRVFVERRCDRDESVCGSADKRDRIDRFRNEYRNERRSRRRLQSAEHRARRCRGSFDLVFEWNAEHGARNRTGRKGSAGTIVARQSIVSRQSAFGWLRDL